MSSGLAVLAPNVGGIGEVIPPESGFLIPRSDDISGYVNAIKRIAQNPQLVVDERDRAMRLLREKYSWEAFETTLARLPRYILTKPLAAHQANGRPKGFKDWEEEASETTCVENGEGPELREDLNIDSLEL
jgi:hypothetical protein